MTNPYPHIIDPHHVEIFYILDLDRTLIRTDDLRGLFEDVIAESGLISRKEIHEARMLVKSNFDMAGFVYGQLTERTSPEEAAAAMTRLRAKFVGAAQVNDYFEPHARELIDLLESRQLAFGILTAGGQDWQQAKIEAVGLEKVPHLIVQTTRKGDLIASWRQTDGQYYLPDELTGQPRVIATSLVFVDDRKVSFLDIPSDVCAIRVLSVSAGEAQEVEEDLPANVTEVTGIDGVWQALFAIDESIS